MKCLTDVDFLVTVSENSTAIDSPHANNVANMATKPTTVLTSITKTTAITTADDFDDEDDDMLCGGENTDNSTDSSFNASDIIYEQCSTSLDDSSNSTHMDADGNKMNRSISIGLKPPFRVKNRLISCDSGFESIGKAKNSDSDENLAAGLNEDMDNILFAESDEEDEMNGDDDGDNDSEPTVDIVDGGERTDKFTTCDKLVKDTICDTLDKDTNRTITTVTTTTTCAELKPIDATAIAVVESVPGNVAAITVPVQPPQLLEEIVLDSSLINRFDGLQEVLCYIDENGSPKIREKYKKTKLKPKEKKKRLTYGTEECIADTIVSDEKTPSCVNFSKLCRMVKDSFRKYICLCINAFFCII